VAGELASNEEENLGELRGFGGVLKRELVALLGNGEKQAQFNDVRHAPPPVFCWQRAAKVFEQRIAASLKTKERIVLNSPSIEPRDIRVLDWHLHRSRTPFHDACLGPTKLCLLREGSS
jgi:hypothetical protein